MVLLDRDGVICENRHDYVKSWQEFQWIPGSKEAIRLFTELGYLVIVVSNQSVVGRGIITEEMLQDIHRRMVYEIETVGGHISTIYCCTHTPMNKCECRKPAPGLLNRALKDYNLAPQQGWLVSDTLDDVLMGATSGLGSVLVLTGKGHPEAAKLKENEKDIKVVNDLLEAVRWISQNDSPLNPAKFK